MSKEKDEISGKVHAIIEKFAERGLRSLGVAFQVHRLHLSLFSLMFGVCIDLLHTIYIKKLVVL
jgi:hypothetical protein